MVDKPGQKKTALFSQNGFVGILLSCDYGEGVGVSAGGGAGVVSGGGAAVGAGVGKKDSSNAI